MNAEQPLDRGDGGGGWPRLGAHSALRAFALHLKWCVPAITPQVPFCIAARVVMAVVLARCSAPERVWLPAPTAPAAERVSACFAVGHAASEFSPVAVPGTALLPRFPSPTSSNEIASCDPPSSSDTSSSLRPRKRTESGDPREQLESSSAQEVRPC